MLPSQSGFILKNKVQNGGVLSVSCAMNYFTWLVLLMELRTETVFLGQPGNTLKKQLSSTLSSDTSGATILNQTELNSASFANREWFHQNCRNLGWVLKKSILAWLGLVKWAFSKGRNVMNKTQMSGNILVHRTLLPCVPFKVCQLDPGLN